MRGPTILLRSWPHPGTFCTTKGLLGNVVVVMVLLPSPSSANLGCNPTDILGTSPKLSLIMLADMSELILGPKMNCEVGLVYSGRPKTDGCERTAAAQYY